MNNLVDYGDDSDEDMSPRRKSSEAAKPTIQREASPFRQRRDSDIYYSENVNSPSGSSRSPSPRSQRSGVFDDLFAEPPPPKRRYSPSPSVRTPTGMSKVLSVSSLVSYAGGEQDEEETFDQAEMSISEENNQSPSFEPAPPPRVSQDGSDEENERLIDQTLADASNAFRENTGGASSNDSATPTPRRNDSPQTPAQNETIEENIIEDAEESIDIPSSPPGECDPDLQRKFENFFEKKAQGYNLNAMLQSRREFLNPACYEIFIEKYELHEKGSNFKPNIFDPFNFPENCYYDAIADEQRKIMEKMTSDKAKKTHRQLSHLRTSVRKLLVRSIKSNGYQMQPLS